MVPLTCFPFSCSDGNGTEQLRTVQLLVSLFSHSIFCNGTVLFEAFPCERNPPAFQFSEQYGTKWTIAFPCERFHSNIVS